MRKFPFDVVVFFDIFICMYNSHIKEIIADLKKVIPFLKRVKADLKKAISYIKQRRMGGLFRQCFYSYRDRWWVPFTTSIALLLIAVLITLFPPNSWLLGFSLIVILPSLIGMLGVTLWQLFRREFRRGLVNLSLFCVSSSICVVVFLMQSFYATSSHRPEDFGKDIVIPKGMHVIQPIGLHENAQPFDIESSDPRVSLFVESTEEALIQGQTINVDASILDAFTGDEKERLFRHLATSVKWLVTGSRDKRVAIRRHVKRNIWKGGLNGFHSEPLNELTSLSKQIQYRILLNLDDDGEPAARSKNDTVVKTRSGPVALNIVNTDTQGMSSNLIIRSNSLSLEIFEQTPSRERYITSAAIKLVEDELRALLASKTSKSRDFDISLMPQESIKRRDKKMSITSEGDGNYFLYSYINPGEPGHVYLKAFEAIENTPLSVETLKKDTIRYTGWSNDPEEKFLCVTKAALYEGSPGTSYPARIEFWFSPQSGKPERKLTQNIYNVEGRQVN